MKTKSGLTNLQKSHLSQLAAKAYASMEKMDLIDNPSALSRSAHMTEWRHEETRKACGLASLKEATNSHFRSIKAHFLHLLGDDAGAFEMQMKTGKPYGRSEKKDTHESRETARHLIISELNHHYHRSRSPHWCDAITENGGTITAPYVEAIARAQFQTDRLDSLTAAQLTRLLYTVRNRIAAREGRGKTADRNKSQRKT